MTGKGGGVQCLNAGFCADYFVKPVNIEVIYKAAQDAFERLDTMGQKQIDGGFSETDRVQEAQRLGAGQYVKKPYTLEKIGLAVRTELEK